MRDLFSTDRRSVLRSAVAGTAAALTGTTASASTSANDSTVDPTLVVSEQTTNGASITLDTVEVGVDSRVVVEHPERGQIAETALAAGTTESAYELGLDEPLVAATEVDLTVVLDALADGGAQISDTATVTVDGTYDLIPSTVDLIGQVTYVEERSELGFHYPYFLYTPPEAETTARTSILVEPTNSGTATDDFSVHRAAGEDTAQSGISRDVADELAVPLLVPVFPRPRSDPVDATHYVHALDDTTLAIEDGPLERVDLQLRRMAAHARASLASREYAVDDGLLLNGFSATGTFVERFAAIHPETVVSVTAGGLNGMVTLPIESTADRTVRYPVGLADLDSLTDAPFSLERFRAVNRFLYMGEIDSNDTIPYGDAWTVDARRETALSVYGRSMYSERFPTCRAVFEDSGVDAAFRVYEGESHTPSPANADIVAVHRRSLDGAGAAELAADFSGNVPDLGAKVVSPETLPVGEQRPFDGGFSPRPDAAVETAEWRIDGDTAGTGEYLTHTFDEPGGHNVELVVTDTGGTTHATVEQVVAGIDGVAVSIREPDDGAEVTEGVPLDVRVAASNAGETTETQSVELTSPVAAERTVTLDPGTETTVAFTIPATEVQGEVAIDVRSANDGDSVTITAVDPCFIATAAYDTPRAEEIDVLRAFRDEVLARNALGRLAIAAYYRTSPPVANWIRRHPKRRYVVREYLVAPIVAAVDRVRG